MRLIQLRCDHCGEACPRWWAAVAISLCILIGLGLTAVMVALIDDYSAATGGRERRLFMVLFLLTLLLWRKGESRRAAAK
jgi:hypothetical protein